MATRRRFLALSLTAGALAAAGLRGCVAWTDTDLPPGLRHMSGTEHAIFQKLVPIFLPVAGTALRRPADVPVLPNVDRILGSLEPGVRSDVALGIRLFDFGAVALGGRVTRFLNLDAERAQAYCETWLRGGQVQRAIFSFLRQFVYVAYWSDPGTWPAVEYDGPITRSRGIPRLGSAPLPSG